MRCFLPVFVFILAFAALQSNGQAPAQTQPATATLPAQIVVTAPPTPPAAPAQAPGTFTALPAPTPAPAPFPAPAAAGPAAPTPPLAAVGPLLPPAAECEPLDQLMMNKYDEFFLLTRLVDAYTLGESQPAMSPPLNASYAPLTILAPSSTIDFLRENNINVRDLASSPLQTILFAPTLAGHFIRGYYPADALPLSPVPTLCGDVCGPVQFTPGEMVQVHRVEMPSSVVNITKPNVAQCRGEWVIHEVNGYLYNNVTDPVAAATPALDLSYALGGEWNTYDVAGMSSP